VWLPTRGRPEPLLFRVVAGTLVDPPRVPGRHVQLFVHGEKVADWHVAGQEQFEATIPAALVGRGPLAIEIRTAGAASAKMLRLGDDP
jgi:hypothetical protein